MKTSIIDIIWAVVSMIVLAVSFRMGHLIYGLLIIYAMMTVIFFGHIFRIRAYMEKSVAVFGKITEYHKEKTGKGFCPVVQYTTEDGREITSIYTVVERKPHYETGTETMICYDPQNPMSFYFAGREEELTSTYYRFIIIGGIISVILLILSVIL
ncbi:MAG: DUF3592 domain-containing protein [Ruminococcus sp.]|nr:DUF3592 domain-containing protein [Ruminococcus sp.]MDE6797335.1 DUF3592 domain-containing protein [Ruminococcus sp.]